MVNAVDSNELNNAQAILVSYSQYLGPLEPIQRDEFCNEFVGWGHKLIKHMGDPLYGMFYGDVSKCADCRVARLGSGMYAPYGLILKELTRDAAIAKYGPVTAEVFGPQGGFKSVTFGETKFTSKVFRPGWDTLK